MPGRHFVPLAVVAFITPLVVGSARARESAPSADHPSSGQAATTAVHPTSPAPSTLPSPPPNQPRAVPPPPPAAVPDSPQIESTSYVGQILLANLVGVGGTVLLGLETHAGWYSLSPYLLVGPIVHVARGNPGRTAISFLLHGASIVGVIGGVALDRHIFCTDFCVPVFTTLGLLGGVGLAIAVDVGLGHDIPGGVAGHRASLTPILSVARSGGGTIGLAATF